MVGGYRDLVARDEAVQTQWAEVERAHRERADAAVRLAGLVEAAGAFAPELAALTAARAELDRFWGVAFAALANDPEAWRRFEAAEVAWGAALDRLLAATARSPVLAAAPAFLQARGQLEGAAERLGVERMRFNEAAQSFNTKRQSLPTALVASLVGEGLRPRARFQGGGGAVAASPVAR